MKKQFTTSITIIASLLISLSMHCQTVNDFEDFTLPASGFLNGEDVEGVYVEKTISLPNSYQVFPTYIAWSGWAISSITDNTTPGFSNQYSSISGTGYDNSINYAVTFVSPETQIKLTGSALGKSVKGFYINNSTYAYFSMLEGDTYAKRFGGESGDDPDYFLLTIKKYYEGLLSSDSINYYLADFRFDNNDFDYIVDDWDFVDLSTLGNIDSLSFTLSSSDNGAFGMNTPAYFCIDNFVTNDIQTSTIDPNDHDELIIFPNPSENIINISLDENQSSQINIFNTMGMKIDEMVIMSNKVSIDISKYPAGQYFLQLKSDKKQLFSKFYKI